MESVREQTCISLIYTLMQVMGHLAEMVYLIGIFYQKSLKFFLRHEPVCYNSGAKLIKKLLKSCFSWQKNGIFAADLQQNA